MDDYSGEKFLISLYGDALTNSEGVKHRFGRKKDDKKPYVVKRYVEQLDRAYKKLTDTDKEEYKEKLKHLYYEENVIKEEVLREKIRKQYGSLPEESVQEAINEVITAQKISLDKWIDYLSNDTAYYPAWAKYWAFQGMLKMGTYDEGTSSYQKRSKDTEEPFVDANPEIIAKAIELVVQKVEEIYGDKNPSKKDIEKLKQEVNFSKLYAVLEKKYVNNVIEYSGTEGIWKKYNQGSKEEALRLNKNLQDKNTHWCTASSESMAISQVCGPYTNAPEGGDFYVYYTKDKEGNYTLPRIAIRMRNHDEIGEIRGILDGQNMEEEMTPILEEKLNEMTFLTEESKKDVFEKLEDLRELTRIYQKITKKEELNEEELNHLYTRKYGFGWTQDPKVEKIIKKRNLINDFEIVKNNDAKKKIMALADELNIDFEIKDESFMEYLMNERTDYNFYKYLAIAMKKFNPKYSKDYDKFVKNAIKVDAQVFKYVSPEDVTNYEELAIQAVEKNANFIRYAKKENIKDYDNLVKKAIEKDGDALEHIKREDVTNYDELVKISLIKNPFKIRKISPKEVTNYEELAKLVVKQNGYLIEDISPENVKDYDELAKLAVTKDPASIKYISPKDATNYEELATTAVTQFGDLIEYINPEDVSNYEELAKLAVENTDYALQYVKKEDVENYEEIVDIANKTASIAKEKMFMNLFEMSETDFTKLIEERALEKYNNSRSVKEKTNLKKSLQKIGEFLKNIKDKNKKNDNDNAPRMGFIDILSVTTLVITTGMVIFIILILFSK